MSLSGRTWTLTAGYVESSANFTGLQSGDFVAVNGGGTLSGAMAIGSSDPDQPVILAVDSGTFMIDAPLDVVGAAVVQGGVGAGASAPQLVGYSPIQIEAGATLSITNDAWLAGTMDITSGGTLDLTGSSLGAFGGTITFDGPGAAVKMRSFGAITVQNFQAGDTITVENTPWTTLTQIAPSEYELGAAILDFGGTTAAGAIYTVTPDGQGNKVITTSAADVPTPISFYDVAAEFSGSRAATAYTGPVAGLTSQYIWSSSDSVALTGLSVRFVHKVPLRRISEIN
jgi:hypothetical protein